MTSMCEVGSTDVLSTQSGDQTPVKLMDGTKEKTEIIKQPNLS